MARTREHGFTLLEVMFAASCLAVCLFALINILPTAGLSVRKAQDMQTATLYAGEVVESVRNQLAQTSTYPPVTSTVATLNGTSYNVLQEVQADQVQGTYVLNDIRVTVKRTDGKGMPIVLITRIVTRAQ